MTKYLATCAFLTLIGVAAATTSGGCGGNDSGSGGATMMTAVTTITTSGDATTSTTTTSTSTGTPDGCFDYTAFDATTPTTTLSGDVMPIFQSTCGLSSTCHGAESAAPGQPFLAPPPGNPPTAAQITEFFNQVVGHPATNEPGMNIIEPGDPSMSFMMHKLDATFTCPDHDCQAAECGAFMPLGPNMLAADKRDVIRRWIAQGANND